MDSQQPGGFVHMLGLIHPNRNLVQTLALLRRAERGGGRNRNHRLPVDVFQVRRRPIFRVNRLIAQDADDAKPFRSNFHHFADRLAKLLAEGSTRSAGPIYFALHDTLTGAEVEIDTGRQAPITPQLRREIRGFEGVRLVEEV